jgi:hypothetical protein
MTILAAVPRSEAKSTIETRASWAVCVTALGIAAVSEITNSKKGRSIHWTA